MSACWLLLLLRNRRAFSMSKQLPTSIFTGATPSPGPEARRLVTTQHIEPLASPPARAHPPTSNVTTPDRLWSLKDPLDILATTPRPSSAPVSGGETETFKAPHPVPVPAPVAITAPPIVAGRKRTAPYTPDEPPASEPLHKRRRAHVHSRHSLDLFNCASSRPLRYDGQPPSPLFFSSSRARPQLPARFSSSEAAARMLSKTRGEDAGIKTVTLARGTFSGLSPPGTTGVPSARSSERSSIPRTASPDARDRADPMSLLGSVGVTELLEHDTRPTFVVDIGDYANYALDSSSLQILFANSALRTNASIWEAVAGKAPEQVVDDTASHASKQFRGWLLTTATQGNEWDANPSPIEHSNVVWSCYTIKKRLRVVSTAAPSVNATEVPSTSASMEFAIPSASSIGHLSARAMDTASSSNPTSEQQDYFGPPIVRNHEELNPLSSMTHNHMSNTMVNDSRNSKVDSSQPNHLTLPSIEDLSFTNECVLRAHSAGDVDSFHREPKATQDNDMGFFDWTRLSLTSTLPKHIQFARSIDWSSTPLGPIEYWSNDLRAMCNLIM